MRSSPYSNIEGKILSFSIQSTDAISLSPNPQLKQIDIVLEASSDLLESHAYRYFKGYINERSWDLHYSKLLEQYEGRIKVEFKKTKAKFPKISSEQDIELIEKIDLLDIDDS